MALLGDDLGGLHHLRGHTLDEERVGAVGLEADRGIVHDFHGLDLGVVASGGELVLGVQHPLEGRLDVLGPEGRAVVEPDARAQLDLPRRVVEGLPRGGQVRAHPARLDVARGQVVEDVVAEDDGLTQHVVGRVPCGDVGLQHVDDGVVLGLGLDGRRDGDSERQNERGDDREGATHGSLLTSSGRSRGVGVARGPHRSRGYPACQTALRRSAGRPDGEPKIDNPGAPPP